MLLKYELIKHINKFNVLLISIMLLLNLGITAYQHRYEFTNEAKNIRETKQQMLDLYNTNKDQYDALYSDFLNRKSEYMVQYYNSLTDDRSISTFENKIINYPNYNDTNLFSDIDKVINAPANFKDSLYSLLRETSDRIRAANNADSYTYNYYIKLINVYDPLTEITWNPTIIKGWNEFFSLSTPSIFLMLTIYGVFCSVFTVENRAEITNLLNISKRGRKKLIIAKLAYTFLASTLLTIIFTLAPLIIFAISTGLSTPNIPIQALDNFTYFRYNITVWQYLVIYVLTKILVILWLSISIAVISQYFDTEIPALVFTVTLALFGILLKNIQPTSKYYEFQKFNLFDIADVNILFNQLKGVNICNLFVDFTYFIIILLLCFIIIIATLSIAKNTYRYKIINDIKISNNRISMSVSILSMEYYKEMVCEGGVYILIIALILKCIASKFYFYPNITSSEAIYIDYMEQLKGPLTEEKLLFIENEYNYIYDTISNYSLMTNAYRTGDISYSDYQKYLNKYNYANYCKRACDRMCERRDYLVAINSSFPNVEFLYEEGVKRLLSIPIDTIGILTAIFLCSNLFAIEYSTGFDKILRLTKKGRHETYRKKLISILIIASFIYFVFSFIDIYFLSKYYNINYLNANIMSIPNFYEVNISCSILLYIIIYKCLGYIGYLNCFLLISALSVIFKNQIKTVIYTSLFIFIPYIIEYYGITVFRIFSVSYLISPFNIKSGIITCICCFAITVVMLYVSYYKWCGKLTNKALSNA